MKGRIMLSICLATEGAYLLKKAGFKVSIKIQLQNKKRQRS